MRDAPDTKSEQYTKRLASEESILWKRMLDVQMPYRWNLRRLKLGFTLDIGCGLGRNLLHIDRNGVGVDHNAASVDVARSRGLEAYLPAEFQKSRHHAAHTFDSILLAHVIEHMTERDAALLLGNYVELLKPGGRAVLITPQERGFRSDATHIQFTDFAALRRIGASAGLVSVSEYSFPFPRWAGRWFTHNEFVSISRKPE
jgi:2-polyprenyl-3-methyl-5-hydroxy-6-metoxy-1,4-benzoquinol methylase